MSNKVLMAAMAAAALVFSLESVPAFANKPVYDLSGQVTTPPVNQQITVNGRTYQIASGSLAESQANEVVQGESVRLTLDGPPNSTSSKVVAIHETHAR